MGYTNQFCVPDVTSVFFSSCDSLVGNSLELNQANRGSLCVCWENAIALHAMQGNRASSRREGGVSWVFSSCGRHLVYILELQRGWSLETRGCSAKSGLLSSYDRHLRNVNEDNMDASGDEAGDQASLSRCHSDIGFPINFQEESGIVTF